MVRTYLLIRGKTCGWYASIRGAHNRSGLPITMMKAVLRSVALLVIVLVVNDGLVAARENHSFGMNPHNGAIVFSNESGPAAAAMFVSGSSTTGSQSVSVHARDLQPAERRRGGGASRLGGFARVRNTVG